MITETSKEINRTVEWTNSTYKITANITENADGSFNHSYGDVHPLSDTSTMASFALNDVIGINLPHERTADEIASISAAIATFRTELIATYNA